jgi:hypothetical protein
VNIWEFNDAEDDDYTASESSIVSSEADDDQQNNAIEHEWSCQQDVNKHLEEDNYLYSSSKSSKVTRKKRSSSLSVSQPSSKKKRISMDTKYSESRLLDQIVENAQNGKYLKRTTRSNKFRLN